MKKKSCYLGILMLYLWIFSMTAFAAEGKKLNIYALYLNVNEKSDSVLLESRGEYLLMDLGTSNATDEIVRQLNALDVKKVSIYFSHMHNDHYGGGNSITEGIKKITAAGIEIERLYLPADEVAPESVDNERRIKRFLDYMDQIGGEVIRLKLGSQFTLGDAVVDIIGPVDSSIFHPGVSADNEQEERYVVYENNCSLAAMVTCGNRRFFTSGDCLAEGAKALVDVYGSSLKADIMKLNHHGTNGGNTKSLLEAVAPAYSFASNCRMDDINPDTGKLRVFTALNRAKPYGLVYLTANNRKTLIYNIENNNIKMYDTSVEPQNLLTGWVEFAGGDGQLITTEKCFLDKNGVPLKGVQIINGKKMYFGQGGFMEYGSYKSSGELSRWGSYPDGKRYFIGMDHNGDAVMATGFLTIDGKKYYFNENGICAQGNGKTEIQIIGGEQYAIKKDGTVLCSTLLKYNNQKYYFDKNGIMLKNRMLLIDGAYRYFDASGKMVRDSKKVKIGKYTYAFDKYGRRIEGKMAVLSGMKYYFDKKGRMVKNKIVTINEKKYYFKQNGLLAKSAKEPYLLKYRGQTYCVIKDGRLAVNEKVLIGKYHYCFNSKGVLVKKKKYTINGLTYYADKKGRIIKNKVQKTSSGSYYFGKDGIMYTNCEVALKDGNYWCGKNGKMKKIIT